MTFAALPGDFEHLIREGCQSVPALSAAVVLFAPASSTQRTCSAWFLLGPRLRQRGAHDHVAAGVPESDGAQVKNVNGIGQQRADVQSAARVGGIRLNDAAVENEQKVVGGGQT